MSRKIPFAFLLFGILSIGAQSGFAQANPPLQFGNNFFVTGDYVVAGAYGMNSMAAGGFTSGEITIPDGNPGITGTKLVPAGAQIVKALLYWQTVENAGVMPGQPGSGQNGFFRPVFTGGPQTGYAMSGVSAGNPVSWASSGCAGGSNAKQQLTTYRAEVTNFLPQDASGNVIVDGTVNGIQYGAYEVRLPSSGIFNHQPYTLGATLVIIFRVLSPDYPLNSIVIYDGDFAPGKTSQTVTQRVQGFYDAAINAADFPVGQSSLSRLTYIVDNVQQFTNETVSLNSHALPLLYGGQTAFPSHYVNWDTVTWTFDDPNNPLLAHFSNPVHEDDSSATTQIIPGLNNNGCTSLAAVIFSTTVKNSDRDGLLDVWKVPAAPHSGTPGYCDASVNEGQCSGPGDPSWVDLPGAVHGEKDVFVQLDYMCSSPNGVDSCTTGNGTDYSFDPRLTGADVMMTNAFSAHGIYLHINPVNLMGTTQPIHAIQEQTCTDNSINPICASVATNGLTPFPGQPGVVGWKAGFEFFKSQPLNYPDEISCEQALNGPCIRRFQNGRKDSYHYALFAHAIGRANWGLKGGSLASVVALDNTVTFTTSAPHGLVVDPHLGNGRVTIADAITNPNLNGTYLVQSVSPPAGVLAITQTSMSALGFATYKFTQVSGPAPAVNDLVTVQNTTNGSAVFNVGNATIATVDPVHSTFTVNFNVNGFVPNAIAARDETGGCAPAVPTGACAHTNRPPFSFTINITTPVSPQTSYTELTDPNLTVTSGQATTGSGFSDIGGADTLVTLGLWGNPAFNGSSPATSPVSDGQKETVQAGTFMHELGHTLGFTHGGLFFDNLAQNPQDYTPTFDANCKSNYQSVMNYMFQSDLLGPNSDVLDFSNQQLKTLDETLLFSIATTDGSAVAFPTTTWYDLTPNIVGSKAKHHCDGSPMFFNANVPPFSADFTPIMYPHLNQALPSPWPANSLDINFDGMIDTGPHGYRGYNDWANIDLRQIGATGSDTAGGGHLGGGPGHLGGGPGHLGGGPGKEEEIDFDTANGVTRHPRNLKASEEVSPRFIDLSWKAPSFGQIGAYRIYRSADGGVTFALIATVPGSQITYRDGVITPPPCNPTPTGYQYFVTAVLAGTFAAFPPGPTEGQESEPSNTVSTGQNNETLTACYGPAGFNFSVPANGVQGSIASITWTLQDLTNTSGTTVNRVAANTLVVTGPLPNSCTSVGDTTILLNGNLTAQSGVSTFPAPNAGQYTLNLDTDVLCAGTYTVKLKEDSTQTTAAASQLQIDVNDTDSTPHVATLALTAGTVGLAYSNTLTQHGGTAPFIWTFTGSLPSGISQQAQNSPTLSGTTCVAGSYGFTAMVTDSRSNSGTQPLTLQINKANTTTGVISNANPSVFQQMVTFTVTVAPQYSCTPTGTVTLLDGGTPIASTNLALSSGGMATFTTSALSVGIHQITASYGGDSNFNGSNSTILVQTVNKASTQTTINSVLPSPATVGQPTTVSYTFGVVLPGTGAPTAPSGTLMVTGSDGSSCMPAPAAVQGSGGCVLYPITAGTTTFTVTYPGDGNFVKSGANGNDTVNIYVSDTAPPAAPPFIPTTTLPSGVVGTPYSNTVYESGGVPDGVTPFKWTIKPGSVTLNGSPVLSIPGLSFQPNTIAANNGTFSGTPTAPGMYTFTAQVTDSPGNTGTQTFTLTVADALFGDLIVVDGASTAGTLFRVTPTGTAGTIAAISNGSPTGVAVDSTSGNIYVAVAPVSGSGTARIVRIGPSGTIGDPFISGGVFTNPVAVAVDGSGNVYLGDNSTNAIYKFTSSGTQVDASGNPTANPFASLPTSSGLPNHIRMAVDTSGNLDAASDSIGGFSGQIEVDEFALSTAAKTVLYNTTANGTYSVTSIASNASGGRTTYTGTFSPTLPVGSSVTIAGFSNAGSNGTFTVQSCSSTQLTVNNGSGVAETPATAGTATLQLTVGGIVVLPADGSIDLADYGTQAIYNIANPGTVSIAIGPTASLCCNISGMANPPSGGANTNLYVTLTGAKSTTPQLQLAVPPSSVTTDNSTLTYSLTAAGTASGGNTTYTGAFSPTIPANAQVTIAGFTNATDNGPFTVVSCTSTTLVVSNGGGVAETNSATAVVATPLTFPNDVAWYSKH